MVIDLILDRKENDFMGIGWTTYKLNEFYVPFNEVFPDEEFPIEGISNPYIYHYSPRAMYIETLGYEEVGEEITRALDYGTEQDVKKALCNYIDKQWYNPHIKEYINSVNWLDGFEE